MASHGKMLALVILISAQCVVGDLLADCTTDPTASSCANSEDFYNSTMVSMDVDNLCMMMSQMPSCTIKNECADGSISGSHCGGWNLLAGVCSTAYGESMQTMGGCATYKLLCVDGTAVENCTDPGKQGPVDLVTTAESQMAAKQYCADNSEEVCNDCDDLKCQTAMTILAEVCKESPSSSTCTEYKKMCHANQGLDVLCPAAPTGDAGSDCLVDPSLDGCEDSETFYNESSVMMDVDNLCMMMSQMPSCAIKSNCEQGAISGKFCGAWSLLSGVCATTYGEDMTGMKGCGNYIRYCAEGSVVESCVDSGKQGPVDLITTAEAQAAAKGYCEGKSEEEVCEECDSLKCQTAMEVLAHVCAADAQNSACSEYLKMCSANEGLDSLCSTDGSIQDSSASLPSLSPLRWAPPLLMALLPVLLR